MSLGPLVLSVIRPATACYGLLGLGLSLGLLLLTSLPVAAALPLSVSKFSVRALKKFSSCVPKFSVRAFVFFSK